MDTIIIDTHIVSKKNNITSIKRNKSSNYPVKTFGSRSKDNFILSCLSTNELSFEDMITDNFDYDTLYATRQQLLH